MRIAQLLDYPTLRVQVDRANALELGVTNWKASSWPPNFISKDFARMRAMFTPFLNSILEKQRYEFSQANIKFHEFILKRSDCGILIDIAKTLYDHMRLIRFRTSGFLPIANVSSWNIEMNN